MNRRFYYARLDKIRDFPRTNLFAPEGLFDLHISDDESGESGRPVNKAEPTTTPPPEDDVLIAKTDCSIPVCPASCETTEPVPEPTIHCSHDCDVVITKAIPSINNPTTPYPQTIDVEPVKRSKSDPQALQ
ncbi:uncharacterized protein C2845_PM01G23580 [Panicum miliaceum]|uniref:Uncharacterized protein n=1 Tax=Panicum miliaceum TaxID=4540 RepID=A0A3L6TKD5_PANMI|nr:uncharacterized protein C2845_PM01G23580 [Panicum miliaceum]